MVLYSGFYLSPYRVPLPDICMIMFAQKNSVSIKFNFFLVWLGPRFKYRSLPMLLMEVSSPYIDLCLPTPFMMGCT